MRRLSMMNVLSFYRAAVIALFFCAPVVHAAQLNDASSREPETPSQYTLTPEKRAQAKTYAQQRHLIYFAGEALMFAALGALARFGLPRRIGRRGIVPATLLVLLAVQLPLDAYSESLSRFYGQSIQDWPSWFVDEGKIWAITLVVGTALLWGIYALVRRSPRRWWLYAWLCSIPLQLAAVFLSPLVLEPMFFRFQPLEKDHPALVIRIEQILHRARVQIPAARLLEMKASEKTNSLNAYVSGFGSSKRLVLWDTIIAKEDPAALLTTVGHELGHYVLHHIRDGLIFSAALTLAGFLCLELLMRLRRGGEPWGDWQTVPWFLLAAFALIFVSTPLVNGFSRHLEHEADRYALEVTHGIVPDAGAAAARAFQVEGESALADPDPGPLIRFWLYDHPPLAERLKFSLAYNPWKEGLAPRYVR
ncbi:MAG TPA: M48 family metallopeptidase [Bryobacteraceae bacterium]|nr:M48 family metallopeptidase [Bryobacteraceae bacterium]